MTPQDVSWWRGRGPQTKMAVVEAAPEIADDELLARARQGDPDAWETVYRRVYPRLFAFARRRLATDEQAEDAISETMARAIDKVGGYAPGPAGLDGWLFGIARLVVLETYRRDARLSPTDPQLLAQRDPETAPDPAAVVAERAEREVMARAFADLSTEDQDVLEMRVVLGLDAAQVAALTARKPGAVRMAQSRALQRLHTRFTGLMA